MKRQHRVTAVIVTVLSLGWLQPASADEPVTETAVDGVPAASEPDSGDESLDVSPSRRALAGGAAFVPGLLLHGSGHWVQGDSDTAYDLLIIEAIGAGLILVGGFPLVLTGGADAATFPTISTMLIGGGFFASSWGLDLVGTLWPAANRGSPLTSPAHYEVGVGYRYIYNPVFDYRNFGVVGARLRWRMLASEPDAWLSAEGGSVRLRVPVSWRLMGPRPSDDGSAGRGDFFDVTAAVVHDAVSDDGVSSLTWELRAGGRLDFVWLTRSLRGFFTEMDLGYGRMTTRYDAAPDSPDTVSLLLMAWKLGVYLPGPAPGGEAAFYFGNRRDGYDAGLKNTGLGSGAFGHLGLEAKVFFTDSWGVLADFRFGSAMITGVSVLYREGRQ